MGLVYDLQCLLLLSAPVLPSEEQTSSSLIEWGDGQQILTKVVFWVTGEEESRPGLVE